uniref:Retrovirus-related Pol polyprotein from transposon TNT 1-94 n=1 Tax=Tanacetum cinerariifolium TaxID=118510 RepID=A0A6L2NM69_TANCI|nr:retrovirus-related Pol polyprotein from transposon TNT 1-94 [Tanacetum cinerariifolium]
MREQVVSEQKADPKVQKHYKAGYKKIKAKLALLEASPSTSQTSKTFQPKNKGLVAETFDWDEEEVSNDKEVTQVKVLMALADDELTVRKNHACNGEWIDITMRKVNILLSMNKDVDWQNYLKYINIDLKFVEEQKLNLLFKYNKIVFELNKCRDELLVIQQARLDAVTFQIQNTKLTKLNHSLKKQLKEEEKTMKNGQLAQKRSFTKLRGNAIDLSIPLSKREAMLRFLYYMICKREDHRTLDHEMYTTSLQRSENYKAQPYQYASPSKQILKAKAKTFLPCTHYGFNDHRPDDCRNYPECGICGS